MKLLKAKGQHILKDVRYIRKIVSFADVCNRDVILEVGCGTGMLTKFLLEKAKKVYGIEIDRRFVNFLKKRFREEIAEGRFILIEGDALKMHWPRFDKFVSNIPYKISSALTFKLFKSNFKLAVVTYQKEFAERLVAKHGSKKYGRLSVIAKAYCKAEIVAKIPPEAFRPVPKVESAIVKITPKPQIAVKNKELFEDLVRFAFSKRRKKFGKIFEEWKKLRCIDIKIPESIKEKRPEEIPAEIFAEIVA